MQDAESQASFDQKLIRAIQGKGEITMDEIIQALEISPTKSALIRLGLMLRKQGWTKHLSRTNGYFWRAPEASA